MGISEKVFGVEYAVEGRNFSAFIVAESIELARKKLAAISNGRITGEVLEERAEVLSPSSFANA